MSEQKNTEETPQEAKLRKLIADLAVKDGMVRREARHELQDYGTAATPLLVEALSDEHENARWEAAKALAEIKDPQSAPALVKALMDERFEVQWLAAEALIALGEDAIVPILRELTTSYGSLYLRQGAHHVLHDLERKGRLEPRIQRVVDELRSLEPLEPFPMTAKRALETLTAMAQENSGVATQ